MEVEGNPLMEKEKKQFIDLYRKSKDITEFLSAEDLEFIKTHKDKYQQEMKDIDQSLDSQRFKEYSTNSKELNASVVNAVSNFNLMKAPHVQLATKSEGMYPLSVSVVYVGSLVNGEPDGKGTAYDTSTRLAVYDGEFKHGQYNGRGKRYFNGKLIEEGDFVNGLLTSGIRHNANGLLECGPFVSNKLNGMGRYVFPNGFYISGSFPAMENVHNVYLAAIPSAKNPTNFVIGATPAQKRSFFFKDGVFISEQEGRGFLFYYNGDVFIGEIEETRPKNGMMFKLSGNEFVKMTVGTVLVSLPYKQPNILLEKDYKYFEMIWSVCWIMI